MKTSHRALNYQQMMAKVFSYIDQHLDEGLTLQTLSDVAGFSKYHFHRQFSAFTGVSLFNYLQLLRLKRASYQLVFHREESIINIAFDAGFSNSESFSRAFKKSFSQTPKDFRKQPLWKPWHQKYQYKTASVEQTMKVEIIDFTEKKIAVYEHLGAVEGLNYSIQKFIEWRKESQLSPINTSATFGLAYSDPSTTAEAEFRFDICGEVLKDVPDNSHKVINKLIPAGRCAQIIHCGPHWQMDAKICYLYGPWLRDIKQNSESLKLRDFPCFFKYLNFFPEVPEHQLITEIYLPLQ